MKAGDELENPVTGERAVVRVGTEESNGELLVADLYVRVSGAVMGEHTHPALWESFEVVRGRLGYRLDGREGVAEPGGRLQVPRGTVHDYEDELYLASPPLFVQRAIFGPLALLGRMLGYRAEYPYSFARRQYAPEPAGRSDTARQVR